MNASENVVTSYVGRWVAFLLIPIIGAATAWLGAHGLDLDPAEVTAWVIGVVGGLITWLYNRGKFEVAKATSLPEDVIDKIVSRVVAEKLPPPPSDRPPGAGSLAAAHAPPLAQPPTHSHPRPTGAGGTSPGQ